MIRQAKGFSLLEVLVAFVIMAVAIAVVLRIFGSGVSNAATLEEYSIAVQIAESLMAKTGVESPLAPGQVAGNIANTYDWSVQVMPVTQTTPADSYQPGSARTLFRVRVVVAWDADSNVPRTVELNTLKTL